MATVLFARRTGQLGSHPSSFGTLVKFYPATGTFPDCLDDVFQAYSRHMKLMRISKNTKVTNKSLCQVLQID